MTELMKFIRPIDIDDSMSYSTNVLENDYPVYDSGTSYSTGDRVIMTTGYHRIYESKKDVNQGHTPPENLQGDDPWWKDIGATNAWKLFDGKSRAATVQSSPLTASVTPGRLFNSMAILNMDATEVNVTVTHPVEGIVYQHDIDMVDNSGILSYYDWFFTEPVRKTNVVLLDLPAYSDATVSIEVTNATGDVRIGEWILGAQSDIGMLLNGYSVGLIDYSTKKVEDGIASIVERTYSHAPKFAVRVPSSHVYAVQNKLDAVRARGVVFVGSQQLQETIVYAFIKAFNIVHKGRNESLCNLELEELS